MEIKNNLTNKSEFDEEGFLRNTSEWTEGIAQNIAFNNGLGELTKNQFSVIKHLRNHFFKTGSITASRLICHESKLGPNCITELFPSHGVAAWKIAGLPDPGEEAKSYM